MINNLRSKVFPLFANVHKASATVQASKSMMFFPHCSSLTAKSYYKSDINTYSARKFQNKKFRGLIDLWKKPLERKRKRQERIKQIKQQLPVPKEQQQKLVVHNSAVGIEYPPVKNEIFCVIKANGFQYKVTEDCVLILDTKEDHEINKKIKFDEVLLTGTKTYTVLGRPFVRNTYVEGVIQSISDSDKTLVFKKKRRKQYKKSFGSRVKLTSFRITKIVHELTPQTLSHAVALVQSPLLQRSSATL